MSNLVPPTTFQNILVWVKPKANKPGHYDVVTEPAAPIILNQDTVITYQIVDTDGYPIVFTHMTVKPENNGQLSKETISLDKKLLAFIDANTVKMTLAINLHFKDTNTEVAFAHDPQLQNDPE